MAMPKAAILDKINLSEGTPYPLGSTLEEDGINFSIFSQNANRIDLCLFKSIEDQEPTIINIDNVTNNIWHLKIKGLSEGQIYGYIVDGKYDIPEGHRFNARKIILDPYAKSIARIAKNSPTLFAYQIESGDDCTFSDVSNIKEAPLAKVVASHFDWEDVESPQYSIRDLIIYEAHVKGFSQLNSKIKEPFRGTYLGLVQPESISYFKELGVTAIELLPVQHFIDDSTLLDKGLKNYWGYNTLNFFAPEPRYLCQDSNLSDIDQFKTMVKVLHENNLEVILDVVYNHTCEGNQLGPTLSFRGIDNTSYYRLSQDKRYYFDTTGCGNMFNFDHPAVLQLLMDSLRYWVTEMHIDGFRFDLASSLAREKGYFDNNSAFFKAVYQDPILNQVKLIAEPWDQEGDGYQVGNFPGSWAEWNGHYRDAIRSYWKGDEGQMAEFAEGFSGSSNLYQHNGRSHFSSINYVTCHDGYTLNDLVSYNDKHNEANQEDNQDGDNHNLSWNCGEEGASENPEVITLRNKQIKNMLTSVLLSYGVPMINAGDEQKRTQKGNNNGYCQDNETTWLPWGTPEEELYSFTKTLINLRKNNLIYKKQTFFTGHNNPEEADIIWFNPDGNILCDEHWQNPTHKSFACFINSDIACATKNNEEENQTAQCKSLIFIFNSHFESIQYTLPPIVNSKKWEIVINTESNITEYQALATEEKLAVSSRSVIVLQELT